MKPRRKKIITYQQVVVPIPKKTILGDSSMVLGHRSASLGYNSLIFKDLHVVPKEPHPNEFAYDQFTQKSDNPLLTYIGY
jgi:hypothetical protein